MRLTHYSRRSDRDFPDIDLDREQGGFLHALGIGYGSGFHKYSPPPIPPEERPPDQVCRTCFETEFGEQLANTYCFDAEWVILGYDDYTGTKNPADWRREAGMLPLEERRIPPPDPPRFMRARGMWGIQIRYYKDTNA